MKATDVEFRFRGLLIGAIFWISFLLYAIDHKNVTERAVEAAVNDPVNSTMLLHTVFWIAAALAALAALLRTWASALLTKEVVHDTRLHSERLVADGPYRFTRNPLYLGTNLLAVAFAPLASLSGAVVMIAAIVFLNYRLIFREESQLAKEQGAAFGEFCARVPRLWPALTPRVAAGGRRPDWASGFASESYFWAFALGEAWFAATLRMRGFVIATAIGVALLFALGWIATRRKTATT